MLFRTEASLNPFLFAVGCPRSGTTLLRRILDAHPDLAMLESEQHWIVRYYVRRKRLTEHGNITPAFIDKLFEHEKFLKLRIDRGQLKELIRTDEIHSYTSLIRALFELYGRMHGKVMVGDKTPENARYISILAGLWPDTKFVHIIRDGRDVALSVEAWDKQVKLKRDFTTWNENFVITTALWWSAYIHAARSASWILGAKRYYEIRYESLVNNPEQETKKLCEFLMIPYSESMIQFHAGKNRNGKDAKHAWLPITPGLRNWKSEMSSRDQERFEAAAGELLTELGYECGRSVSEKLKNSVLKIQKQFALDFEKTNLGATTEC